MDSGKLGQQSTLDVLRARSRVRRLVEASILALLLAASNTAAGNPDEPPANLFRLFQKNSAAVTTTPHPAVVRVIVDEGRALANGTGSLVAIRDSHGIVVTNWHVVREASGKIEVVFPDGFRSAATILKTDPDWDLAALLIWRPKVEPLRISQRVPQPGDPLTIAGYGQGDYRSVTGRCTQYVAPSPKHPYEIVELSAQARQGDSGGPILNEQGELAGVLFGASRGSTSGSYCARVRTFLDTAWPANESSPSASPSIPAPFVAFQPPPPQDTQADEPSEVEPPQTSLIRLDEPDDSPSLPPSPKWEPDPPPAKVVLSNTPPPARQPISTTQIDLEKWIGTSALDRTKSVLALIGLLAVWGNLARLLSK